MGSETLGIYSITPSPGMVSRGEMADPSIWPGLRRVGRNLHFGVNVNEI